MQKKVFHIKAKIWVKRLFPLEYGIQLAENYFIIYCLLTIWQRQLEEINLHDGGRNDNLLFLRKPVLNQ